MQLSIQKPRKQMGHKLLQRHSRFAVPQISFLNYIKFNPHHRVPLISYTFTKDYSEHFSSRKHSCTPLSLMLTKRLPILLAHRPKSPRKAREKHLYRSTGGSCWAMENRSEVITGTAAQREKEDERKKKAGRQSDCRQRERAPWGQLQRQQQRRRWWWPRQQQQRQRQQQGLLKERTIRGKRKRGGRPGKSGIDCGQSGKERASEVRGVGWCWEGRERAEKRRVVYGVHGSPLRSLITFSCHG